MATSAEVLQELIHVYLPVGRDEALEEASRLSGETDDSQLQIRTRILLANAALKRRVRPDRPRKSAGDVGDGSHDDGGRNGQLDGQSDETERPADSAGGTGDQYHLILKF